MILPLENSTTVALIRFGTTLIMISSTGVFFGLHFGKMAASSFIVSSTVPLRGKQSFQLIKNIKEKKIVTIPSI